MSTAVRREEIEALMLGDLHSRPWDQHPELRLILSEDDGTPWIGDKSLIPAPAWSIGCVADVLGMFAAAIQRDHSMQALLRESQQGAGVQGVLLYSETWEAPKPATIAEEDQLMALACDHRLREHPGRIEARMLHAALADGSALSCRQRRGEEPQPGHLLDGPTADRLQELRFFLCEPS